MTATSDATWYWADGNRRNGPVMPADLARLAAGGQLRADHLVWTDGMAEWKPAGQVGGLAKHLERGAAGGAATSNVVTPVRATTVQPLATILPAAVQPIAGGQIGYYTPTQGMPPRAAAALRKHAAPRGDTGDWPLDDARVGQFVAAAKLRK